MTHLEDRWVRSQTLSLNMLLGPQASFEVLCIQKCHACVQSPHLKKKMLIAQTSLELHV